MKINLTLSPKENVLASLNVANEFLNLKLGPVDVTAPEPLMSNDPEVADLTTVTIVNGANGFFDDSVSVQYGRYNLALKGTEEDVVHQLLEGQTLEDVRLALCERLSLHLTEIEFADESLPNFSSEGADTLILRPTAVSWLYVGELTITVLNIEAA